ncbi:MAG: hypothetical protein ABW185_11670 [Sedimenticola sp.]
MRANYQAAIWRHYLETDPDIPSPVADDDGRSNLVEDWIGLAPAPEPNS